MLDTLIGIVAATLTTSSFIPQILKAHRRRSMDDLSPLLMIMFSTGAALWLVYGIFRVDPIIIMANIAALIFNIILLVMKTIYRYR
jgi:MtN3 and saliva related transmembrane protein